MGSMDEDVVDKETEMQEKELEILQLEGELKKLTRKKGPGGRSNGSNKKARH